MRIGIGVTSYKRPDLLAHFQEQLKKCAPENKFDFCAVIDVPNIADAKNSCLKALKDCDYIFLFDDDTFPKQSYWDVPFINSGLKYSIYMNNTYSAAQEFVDVTRYHDCAGCFIFLTKEIFEKVGYFNKEYGRYGYEHVGYSHRLKRATGDWAYVCLNETKNYIHSLDLDGPKDWGLHHAPTIGFAERTILSEANKGIYEKEISSSKLYYEYE